MATQVKGRTTLEVGADGVALITIINPPVNSLSFDGMNFMFFVLALLLRLILLDSSVVISWCCRFLLVFPFCVENFVFG